MKNLIPAVYSSAVKTSMGSSRLATSFCKNQASIATYQMTSSRYIHQTTLVSESVKDMDASEKVKKLTEEILTLNVIEVNQLLFTLQVSPPLILSASRMVALCFFHICRCTHSFVRIRQRVYRKI